MIFKIFKDVSTQKEGGLLIRKIANFTKDSIVFQMKKFEESRFDIQRLSRAYAKEPAFKFNESEMTYFEKLFRILDPKNKAKGHM